MDQETRTHFEATGLVAAERAKLGIEKTTNRKVNRIGSFAELIIKFGFTGKGN